MFIAISKGIWDKTINTEARDINTDQIIWSKTRPYTWMSCAEHNGLWYFIDHLVNKDTPDEKRFGILDPQTGEIKILYRKAVDKNVSSSAIFPPIDDQ